MNWRQLIVLAALLGCALGAGRPGKPARQPSSNATANCGDLECDPFSESCCPDINKGPVCCIKETTFCCPTVGPLASRCCPRWTVCCPHGRDGCCSPDLGWGWDGVSEPAPLIKPAQQEAPLKTSPLAYGLFMKATLTSTPIRAAKIDLTSGSQTEVTIENSAALDWGEMPRIFAYNPDANVYYLPQANFTHPEASRDDPKYPITLYTADPVNGSLTAKRVQGAVNQVSGYYYNVRLQKLIIATYTFSAGKKSGYNFYTLDPVTAVATLKSSNSFSGEANDTFVGWFHSGTQDGNTVYRLGNQDVVNELRPGMGSVDISGPQARGPWLSIPYAADTGMYITLSHIDDTTFISLAPSTTRGGALDIVRWSLKTNNATVVASTTGFPPRIFGPVWEAVSPDASTYVAGVVKLGANPTGVNDKWQVVVLDLATNQAQTFLLDPDVSGATASICGMGIPK